MPRDVHVTPGKEPLSSGVMYVMTFREARQDFSSLEDKEGQCMERRRGAKFLPYMVRSQQIMPKSSKTCKLLKNVEVNTKRIS